jgi:hypothetical protein
MGSKGQAGNQSGVGDPTFGFYDVLETAGNDGYIGGLLVTDVEGVPVEFRVTYPVKPNAVQRLLYGGSLVPHIGVQLCGIPLVKALDHEIDLLVVHKPELLALGTGIRAPVLLVERQEKAAVSEGDEYLAAKRTVFQPASEAFVSVLVSHPPSANSEGAALALQLLRRLSERVDVAEPLDRIKVAVRELEATDKRFS